MRTIYVEGCPCEVLEENIEWGIVHQSGNTMPSSDGDRGKKDVYHARPLCVAPDGTLVLPNPYALHLVDSSQPDDFEMGEHLRTLAKEVTRRTH